MNENLEWALTVMQMKMTSRGIERMIKREQTHHLKNSKKRILTHKTLEQKLRSQDLACKLKVVLLKKVKSSDSAMGAVLNDAVRLSYALHLMLVFPLLNFSLRVNLDKLCINISAQGLVQFWALKRCKLERLTKCKG
ncbi:hypothetical protein ACFX12_033879 [Malus domestica]